MIYLSVSISAHVILKSCRFRPLSSRVSRFFSTRGMRWEYRTCWLLHLWRLLSYILTVDGGFAATIGLIHQCSCSFCCFFWWRWAALQILSVPGDHSCISGSFSCSHASFLLEYSVRDALKRCTAFLRTQQHRITFSMGEGFALDLLSAYIFIFCFTKAALCLTSGFSSLLRLPNWGVLPHISSASQGVRRWLTYLSTLQKCTRCQKWQIWRKSSTINWQCW